MKLYLAGPMSGLPEYNYPAFNAADEALTSLGFEVLNPVDAEILNPTPGVHQNWDWYMRQAIIMVAQADAIAFLPGWQGSRGARLEHRIGTDLKMPMRSVENWLSNPQGIDSDSIDDVEDDFEARTKKVADLIERIRSRHRDAIESVVERRVR